MTDMNQCDQPVRSYKRRSKTSGRLVQYPRGVPKPYAPRHRVRHEPPQPFEITALRTRLGKTRTEFANLMGTVRYTVWQWERGLGQMGQPLIPLFRNLQQLSDHVLQRRANPDWTL